jgi:hypothetical protein
MTTLKQAARMALEALEMLTDCYDDSAVGLEIDAIKALRAALADHNEEVLEMEPVAQCPHCNGSGDIVVMDSAGPDALEVPAPCPHCGGSGSLADAYHGVVKLLEKKSDDYLKCCAELYVRPIAPQPIRQLKETP